MTNLSDILKQGESKGNIRHIAQYVQALPEWDILDGCFGKTRIKPTDIDGCVERNGQCLFLEMKGPNAGVSTGQAILFENLVKQGSTVIVFWATHGGRHVQEMLVMTPEKTIGKQSATLDDLRLAVSNWFATADGNSRNPP